MIQIKGPESSRGAALASPRLAPAKINLTLEIPGKRADGYHEINSLVAFADIGDQLRFFPDRQDAPGGEISLEIVGRFATALQNASDDNLILRAAAALRAAGFDFPGGKIQLEKNLPVASGIGGGSTDAAAALRLLSDAASERPSADALNRIALQLGADVPVCLRARACMMRGVGEVIEEIGGFPAVPALLVNAGAPVSTKAVFDKLGAPSLAADWRRNADAADIPLQDWFLLLQWLKAQRNALQSPAYKVEWAVFHTLRAIGRTHKAAPYQVIRMSGSGGTCFALYDDLAVAEKAADKLREAHPEWWVAPAMLR